MLRQTSNRNMKKGEGSAWVKPEKRGKKYEYVPWKGKEVMEKGKTMWGPDYRYRFRIQNTIPQERLGKPLRKTVHTGYDNPASFMFHELKKQHRIPGELKTKWKRAPKRAPRFKVSSRIGKLHHNNVNNPLFADIDPL